jgi:hypothetical protein
LTVTNNFVLGMPAAVCTLPDDSMTASLHHPALRAGFCFTQSQQRCAAMRPVVVSVWNKKTGAGNQT